MDTFLFSVTVTKRSKSFNFELVFLFVFTFLLVFCHIVKLHQVSLLIALIFEGRCSVPLLQSCVWFESFLSLLLVTLNRIVCLLFC